MFNPANFGFSYEKYYDVWRKTISISSQEYIDGSLKHFIDYWELEFDKFFTTWDLLRFDSIENETETYFRYMNIPDDNIGKILLDCAGVEI